MGRPSTQRQPMAPRLQPSQELTPESSRNHLAKSQEVNNLRSPNSKFPDSAGSTTDESQTDPETFNLTEHSLDGVQTDIMDLLVVPEVAPQADMSWSVDFSYHINSDTSNHEPFYQDASWTLPSTETFLVPESDHSKMEKITRDTAVTREKLLQLQCQLHGLMPKMEYGSAIDHVDETLEITKSFLEILQASLAAQRCFSQQDCSTAQNENSIEGPEGQNDASSCRKKGIVCHVTLLQFLICYSYVLHVLDCVVIALTSKSGKSPALSLGLFNLASQPALNADIVLHIVLQLIQRLRGLIHTLALTCKDLTGRSPPTADDKMHATPVAISFYAVIQLMSEREKSLVEILSGLASGEKSWSTGI